MDLFVQIAGRPAYFAQLRESRVVLLWSELLGRFTFDTECAELSTFSKGNHISCASRAKLNLTFHLKPETS